MLFFSGSAEIASACLRLLADAAANPSAFPGSAEPEKSPVAAILVTAENAANYLESFAGRMRRSVSAADGRD